MFLLVSATFLSRGNMNVSPILEKKIDSFSVDLSRSHSQGEHVL